jgi:hypothetical protein
MPTTGNNKDLEPPTLSHVSNALIFAQLATPQVVDHNKLEQLQARNHIKGVSLNRQSDTHHDGNVSVVVRPPQRYRPPSEDGDNDSVGDIVRDALTRPPLVASDDDDDAQSRRSTPHFETISCSRSPSQRSGHWVASPQSDHSGGDDEWRSQGSNPKRREDDEDFMISAAQYRQQTNDDTATTQLEAQAGARALTPDTTFTRPSPSNISRAPDTGNVFPRLPRVGDLDPYATDPRDTLFGGESSNARPDPTLADLRARFTARQHHVASPPTSGGPATSYADLLRQATRMRVGGGEEASRRRIAPRDDPDYAEKSELMIRVDELRQLGFSIPQELDASWPVEELRHQIKRRTICISTVAYVNWYIDAICTFARGVEYINNLLGPFLPLQDYHKTIKEKTHTERFRYALYQLVLRFHGRSTFNPWREILSVLVAPLATALGLKVLELLARRKLGKSGARGVVNGLGGLMRNGGLGTLLKGMTGTKGSGATTDAQSAVPAGIDGISEPVTTTTSTPGRKNDAFGGLSAFGTGQNPFSAARRSDGVAATAASGAFGGDYIHVKNAPPPTTRPPPPPPPINRAVPDRRRPRLMRPEEVMSDLASGAPPGAVVTGEQLSALQSMV